MEEHKRREETSLFYSILLYSVLSRVEQSRDGLTCHLLTRSLELIAKKVESASVATAFAKNDLPVPGGPYSSMPSQQIQTITTNTNK